MLKKMALAVGFIAFISSMVLAADVASNAVNEPEKPKQVFYASKNGSVYHKPGCSAGNRISSKNLKVFSSKEEANKAGYSACSKCRP